MSAAVHKPLWDVVEEHLDEASFLGSQWERGLDSHDCDLAQLADGVERRLVAHLDALLVGGDPVVARTLMPALTDEHRPTCFAAALALLASPASRGLVLDAWTRASAQQRAPLTRALACSPVGAELVRPAVTDADPARRAAAIEVLGFHRALRPGEAATLAGDPDPQVRAALVGAATRTADPRLAAAVRAELGAPTPERAAAALTAAAVLGLPELGDLRHEALARADACADAALLLVALTPGPRRASILLASDRPAAIFALGFTGSRAAADRCLELAAAGQHVALAFEAFLGITGAVLPQVARPDEDALPPLADDLAAPPPRPEDALPLPDLAAWTAWWRAQRERLPPDAPLPGHVEDRPALLAALRHAPMRRRHALALRLALDSRGREQLETRASARRQLAELRRLA